MYQRYRSIQFVFTIPIFLFCPSNAEVGISSRDWIIAQAVYNKNYSATNFSLKLPATDLSQVKSSRINITMAAVYKAVNKKKARQSIEEDVDNDMDVGMEELLNDADDTTDSEEEQEEEDRITAAKKQLAQGFMPKTRVLILTSRGVTHR